MGVITTKSQLAMDIIKSLEAVLTASYADDPEGAHHLKKIQAIIAKLEKEINKN